MAQQDGGHAGITPATVLPQIDDEGIGVAEQRHGREGGRRSVAVREETQVEVAHVAVQAFHPGKAIIVAAARFCSSACSAGVAWSRSC
jgi:hypothetical protein